MNIYLTFDYELFFGPITGSVDKCMIEPTNQLLGIAKRYKIPMTFFVDVGFLIRLEQESENHPELAADLFKIKKQLNEITSIGSSIQLHIHPHWERATYGNGKWEIDVTNCYKLSDFSQKEIDKIVEKYKMYLDNLIGVKTSSFRAGGWCIQPFHQLYSVFKRLGIKIDSSVFSGAHFESENYFFDFRTAPQKAKYNFEDDVCIENENGYFTEYPISSFKYSPFFYWRLYLLGRLFPKKHKMLGDGVFLAQPGRKKSVLTNYTWNHVSSDGYYASKLDTCLKNQIQMKKNEFVVIGHPKGNTLYSLKKLEHFIQKNYTKCSFKTFSVEE
jgi:hypothetical protein